MYGTARIRLFGEWVWRRRSWFWSDLFDGFNPEALNGERLGSSKGGVRKVTLDNF